MYSRVTESNVFVAYNKTLCAKHCRICFLCCKWRGRMYFSPAGNTSRKNDYTAFNSYQTAIWPFWGVLMASEYIAYLYQLRSSYSTLDNVRKIHSAIICLGPCLYTVTRYLPYYYMRYVHILMVSSQVFDCLFASSIKRIELMTLLDNLR